MTREQLIDPEELSARLGDADLVIVDCRFDLADPDGGRKSYAEGHIPAAVFMDLNQVREETERWLEDYNTIRPHESLGDVSPVEFLNGRGLADLSSYGWT